MAVAQDPLAQEQKRAMSREQFIAHVSDEVLKGTEAALGKHGILLETIESGVVDMKKTVMAPALPMVVPEGKTRVIALDDAYSFGLGMEFEDDEGSRDDPRFMAIVHAIICRLVDAIREAAVRDNEALAPDHPLKNRVVNLKISCEKREQVKSLAFTAVFYCGRVRATN